MSIHFTPLLVVSKPLSANHTYFGKLSATILIYTCKQFVFLELNGILHVIFRGTWAKFCMAILYKTQNIKYFHVL